MFLGELEKRCFISALVKSSPLLEAPVGGSYKE